MVQASYCHTPEGTEQNATGNKRINYIIAQVMAAVVGTLLILNVSSMNSMMTIVNGVLNNETSSRPNVDRSKEYFLISDAESSLYGTVFTVTHLFGNILSGIYQDVFGRRNGLFVSILPQMTSWFILYFSKNAYWLYLHAIAVGMGAGLCEHVVFTYISEIASVELRGRLFSVGKIGFSTGFFLPFVLYNKYCNEWRKLALGFSILPIIIPLCLFWLPESPVWLLTKMRDEECRRSLMWLRGWTSDENIEKEYQNILAQLKQRKAAVEENAKYTTTTYMKLFTKPEFLEPFKISLALLFSSFLLSLRPLKQHMFIVLGKLGADQYNINPEDPHKQKGEIMMYSGVAGIVGSVLLVLTIRKCGKRALTLWTFSVSAIFVFLLALYSMWHTNNDYNALWIVYVLSALIHFLGGYTLGGIPWMFISEIFPQKYRGFCSGITGMVGHSMSSILTATFLSTMRPIGLSNVLYLYCTLGIVFLLYLSIYLPETENKSLHDIEEYFKKTNKDTAEDDGSQSVCVKLCNVDLVSSESKNEDDPEKV